MENIIIDVPGHGRSARKKKKWLPDAHCSPPELIGHSRSLALMNAVYFYSILHAKSAQNAGLSHSRRLSIA